MATILFVLLVAVAAFGALFVLERVVAWTIPWIAPLLPNVFAGPDGWLLDTRRAKGVFDRHTHS